MNVDASAGRAARWTMLGCLTIPVLGICIWIWPRLAGVPSRAALLIGAAVFILVIVPRFHRFVVGGQARNAAGKVLTTRDRSGIRLAYLGFAWIAAMLCALHLSYVVPIETSNLQALAMLVGLPLFIVTIPIALITLVLSVIHWRERPLLIMSACIVSAFVVSLAQAEWGLVGGSFADAVYFAATVPLVILCVRWFTRSRQRA